MTWVPWAVAALAVGVALSLVPLLLIRRAQDRLAGRKLDPGQTAWKLLTRAELVVGRYRRLPGILGLAEDRIAFEGVFGETAVVATARIQKIVTGRRLASERLLVRREVLRISAAGGPELEFVLTHSTAEAWRSHLGLWAARERQSDADRVTPGRR
jgi:hypothetical protein